MKYRLYEFVSFLLNLPKNYFMRIIFLFCFFFASFVSLSQSYKISGSVSGLNNDSVILAYYFGGKQYAVDTAASNEGKFVFQGKKQLGGGMYMVVLPDQKYFDIIISEQVFSFSTNLNSLIEDMQFKNSKENPPLYEYLNFISQKKKIFIPELNKTVTIKLSVKAMKIVDKLGLLPYLKKQGLSLSDIN